MVSSRAAVRLLTRRRAREAPDDPPQLIVGESAAERAARLPLSPLEEGEPESTVAFEAAEAYRSRPAALLVHADIVSHPMKPLPAESLDPMIEAAPGEARLLSRLALWLAEVAAEAARPSTGDAPNPPLLDLTQ